MRTPGSYEREREEALDARIEAHIEAREQHEDEISDAGEIDYSPLRPGTPFPQNREPEPEPRPAAVNKAVLQTAWRRIKRPSRETIRRLTQ